MPSKTELNKRLIEFDVEHHCGMRIAGQFVFACFIEDHAYHCEQLFDFCPSCSMPTETFHSRGKDD